MFNKESKNLSLAIIILFSLILIVLVFKTGLIIGGGKSHFSSCDYKKGFSGHMGKNFSGHMDKKFAALKKSAYSDYRLVTELTDDGFVVKGADSTMLTVLINEDTVVYKGEEKSGEVVVGDKVYVSGTKDNSGNLVAREIKVYDASLKK